MTLGTDTNSLGRGGLVRGVDGRRRRLLAGRLAADDQAPQSDPASRPIPGRRAQGRGRRPIRLPSTGIRTSRRTSGPTENARSPRRTHGSRPAAGRTTLCGSTAWWRIPSSSPTLGCSPCRSGTDHPALLHPGLVGNRQMGRRADAAHLRAGAAGGQRPVGGVLFVRRGAGGGGTTTAIPSPACPTSRRSSPIEMNGEPLNESHGAPLRLRDEVELGFKQVKWIEGDRVRGGHSRIWARARALQRGTGVLRLPDADLTGYLAAGSPGTAVTGM